LKDDAPDTLTWRWTKGEATSLDDWGTPPATTGYVVCVYGPGPGPFTSARVPAGGTCGVKPCWKATGTRGFTYVDPERTPDGVLKLRLAAGEAGRAKIVLTAKGDGVPSLSGLVAPVRVQLQGNGRCWEAAFSVDRAAAPEVFRAMSD
jgi:hypothetical protein